MALNGGVTQFRIPRPPTLSIPFDICVCHNIGRTYLFILSVLLHRVMQSSACYTVMNNH